MFFSSIAYFGCFLQRGGKKISPSIYYFFTKHSSLVAEEKLPWLWVCFFADSFVLRIKHSTMEDRFRGK